MISIHYQIIFQQHFIFKQFKKLNILFRESFNLFFEKSQCNYNFNKKNKSQTINNNKDEKFTIDSRTGLCCPILFIMCPIDIRVNYYLWQTLITFFPEYFFKRFFVPWVSYAGRTFRIRFYLVYYFSCFQSIFQLPLYSFPIIS